MNADFAAKTTSFGEISKMAAVNALAAEP